MLNVIDEFTQSEARVGWRFLGPLNEAHRIELSALKRWRLLLMLAYFPDHSLPLVQLKERRRDLVIALRNRKRPPAKHELMEIAWVQQAISAVEEVIADLDAGIETDSLATKESAEASVCRRMW
jgi:hypothetical protein